MDTEYNQSFPANRSSNNVVELLCMGMEVALFDCQWLRMLDQKMEYDIRHGDRNSAEFKALTGLLTGDPASPVRWNFFMADLIMLEDDSILSGIRIAIPAQSRRYTSNPLSAAGFAAQTERTHHAVLTKLHCCQHDQEDFLVRHLRTSCSNLEKPR